MWDPSQTQPEVHLSHDRLCPRCGHAMHTYLPCSDTCWCEPPPDVVAAPLAVAYAA